MAIPYRSADAVTVWPKGEYDAELVKVEEKTSKVKPDGSGGNPMEVWTIRVFGRDGGKMLLSEHVVIPGATFKIKQLARALGKEAEFQDETFHAENNIGAVFRVALAIEEQDGFDDKNRIQKFIPAAKQPVERPTTAPYPKTREAVTAAAPSSPFEGEQAGKGIPADDIPF